MEKLPFLMFREHSSLEYALLISEKSSYKGAARDVTYTSVPGRSGDLLTDNGRYKNITIPYKLSLLNTTDRSFAVLAHQIKGWLLSEAGYFRLWDSYDGKYFRRASYNDEADIEQVKRVYHLVKERGLKIAAAREALQKNREGKVQTAEAARRLREVRAQLVELRSALDSM